MKYAIYKIRFPQGDTPESLIIERGGTIKNLLSNAFSEMLAEVEGNFSKDGLYLWNYREVASHEALGFAVALDPRITQNETGVLIFPPVVDPMEALGENNV